MSSDVKENNHAFDLEDALNNVDLSFSNYTPSQDSLEFFVLMRLVEGADFEFDTPIAHYFIIDLLFGNITRDQYPYNKETRDKLYIDETRIGIMISRACGKSTVITAFFPVYCAIKGVIPNYGKVRFIVLIGASAQGGARTMMKAIASMCEESVFCNEWFESMRFTETEFEVVRKGPGQAKHRTFLARALGAKTPTRGIRDNASGSRPDAIIFDDAVADSSAANSETQMEVLKANIEADAGAALKGGDKGKIILVFTPFNLRDPNTSALVNGQFTPVAFPICERIDKDMTKAEWKGLWPEMHSYESVKRMYMSAIKSKSSMRAFMQERMLRLASSDDRMIPTELLDSMWYDRKDVLKHLDDYRLYMTTDLTSSSEAKGDFAGMAVWAVGPEGDMFMLGLSLRKQSIGDQYDSLFNLIQIYGKGSRSIEVGVEVDGNQRTHIYALEGEMRKRNVWFTFARQRGAGYGSKGILSKKAGGNKHERFSLALPNMQDNKIWLPNELKDTPDMRELIHELENVTYEGFASAHDDGCDLISQTIAMEIVVPPKRFSLGKADDEEDVWGDIDRGVIDASAGYTD
jgi:hypothetical protein